MRQRAGAGGPARRSPPRPFDGRARDQPRRLSGNPGGKHVENRTGCRGWRVVRRRVPSGLGVGTEPGLFDCHRDTYRNAYCDAGCLCFCLFVGPRPAHFLRPRAPAPLPLRGTRPAAGRFAQAAGRFTQAAAPTGRRMSVSVSVSPGARGLKLVAAGRVEPPAPAAGRAIGNPARTSRGGLARPAAASSRKTRPRPAD